MKTLNIVVLAGVVMLSAPVAAQEDLTTTVTNMVVEQSSKALESIQENLSKELSKKLEAAMSNLALPELGSTEQAPAEQDDQQ